MSAVRSFAVTPPDLRVPGLIFAVVLFTCVGVLALSWHEIKDSAALWITLPICFLAPLVIVVALIRRKVTFDGETLHIVAGLNQTRVPVASLLPGNARVVDLETSNEYRLGIKTFGTAMPGYYAGHFQQIKGQKVFALVTDKHRVLMLPERDGRRLMLSLEKPQTLLDALQAQPRAQ